ncbi:hypothetical protein JS562_52595, partial [Agrobacterium sp. S2]|nr:hypothetical protein [Agrobacterium sp. S2]
ASTPEERGCLRRAERSAAEGSAMSVRPYEDSRGNVVGTVAVVNVQVGDVWRKRKKVFRDSDYGGRRGAKQAAQEWEIAQKRLLRRGEYVDTRLSAVSLRQFRADRMELIYGGAAAKRSEELRPRVEQRHRSGHRSRATA